MGFSLLNLKYKWFSLLYTTRLSLVLKIIVSIRTSTLEKIVEGIWPKDADAKTRNKQVIKVFKETKTVNVMKVIRVMEVINVI